MFEVGVRAIFEAAHRLRGDFGPATRLHGHTYQVEVAVRGSALAADGTLIDVGLLRRLLDTALAPLHYQDLDALEVFRGQNSTAEVVARYLFSALRAGLADTERVTILRVSVWESPSIYGSYEGPLRGHDQAP
jgi:6-pyruvoyltetrahydropterin/6-carboxytetrahydropterin synthase